LEANVVGEKSVEISWKTIAQCTGSVKVGSTTDNVVREYFDTRNKTRDSNHVVIINTDKNRRFYFFVMSNNVAYGIDDGPISFFGDSL